MPDGDEEARIFRVERPAKRRFDATPIPDSKTGRSFRLETQPNGRRMRVDESRMLVRLPNSDRELLFAQQRNARECGPCLILNTLSALGIQSGLSAPTDVREYANQLRITANEAARARGAHVDDPRIPPEGWFFNGDVDEVLRAQGLDVQSWHMDSPERRAGLQAYIDQLRKDGQEAVIYSGTGRHFRRIYQTVDRSYMLDSLRPDITQVDANSVQSMIAGAASSTRIESVAVATRPVTPPTPSTE